MYLLGYFQFLHRGCHPIPVKAAGSSSEEQESRPSSPSSVSFSDSFDKRTRDSRDVFLRHSVWSGTPVARFAPASASRWKNALQFRRPPGQYPQGSSTEEGCPVISTSRNGQGLCGVVNQVEFSYK